MRLDESYLLFHSGRAHTASAGYLQLSKVLSGLWRILLISGLATPYLRDWFYELLQLLPL